MRLSEQGAMSNHIWWGYKGTVLPFRPVRIQLTARPSLLSCSALPKMFSPSYH